MDRTTSLRDRPDLGEEVCEIVRDQIYTLKLPPGGRINIVQLADRLGLSYSPIKEALNRLVGEGLVRDVRRRGYFVCRMEARDVQELLRARLVLELAAVEDNLDGIGPAQIHEMRGLVDQMERALMAQGDQVDRNLLAKLDCSFHVLIVGNINNRRLSEMYRSLNLQFAVAGMQISGGGASLDLLASAVQGHRAIADATGSRDLPEVRRVIREHILTTARWYAERWPQS